MHLVAQGVNGNSCGSRTRCRGARRSALRTEPHSVRSPGGRPRALSGTLQCLQEVAPGCPIPMRCDHAALAVVLAASLTAVSPAAEKAPKPKRPQLELRALPQIAFAPVTVMFSVDLEGGDDIEEYYC